MKFNGRNIFVSTKARIGINVRIGDNAAIYDNVEVGDNSTICNDVVIGEPLLSYYVDPDYCHPVTRVGSGSLIRSHSIIYAGCIIGDELSTGHHVTVRENSTIGDHCSIGTLCDIQGGVTIGRYCRLHSNVHISQTCVIEDFVFMYPFSVMTNDACPPSEKVTGGTIGTYSQIGVHAVVLPGIRIGENCLVGANSVVNKNIPDFSLVTGDPAELKMDVRKYIVLGKGKPYPWMYRFDRGMPWEHIGFANWIAKTGQSASVL